MSRITLNQGTLHQYTPSGQDIQGEIILDRLRDVTVTNVQNNQILKYDSTASQWVNTSTGAVTTLDSLSDVTITAVSNGQSLQYNSTTSKWENADIVANSIDGGNY
jgi:hypothetical protein